LCLASALTLVAPAAAQRPTGDKALAEALFRDGRALFQAGNISAACSKFAASERIEPKLGTLLNLATCHESEGKTASAWAEFSQAVARAEQAHHAERETFARERRAALEKRLSMLHLDWEHPATGETVKLDGLALQAEVIGTPFPVDPGEHVMEATAPGRASWQKEFVVEAGPSALSIRIPELSPAPAAERKTDTAPAPAASGPAAEAALASSAAAVRPAPPGDASPVPSSPVPPSETHRGLSNIRIAGLVSGGVAIVAVGVGTYYGARAFSTKAKAEEQCDGRACEQYGLDLFDDMRRYANISTVGFTVGVLSLAASVYLLTRPDPAAKAIQSRLAIGVDVDAHHRGGTFRVAW
jgi:hypothetical protein